MENTGSHDTSGPIMPAVLAAGGSVVQASVRRALSQNLAFYTANVGGLHLTGRTAGAAVGAASGALGLAAAAGSAADRVRSMLEMDNDDAVRSKVYSLIVLAETQTRHDEKAESFVD